MIIKRWTLGHSEISLCQCEPEDGFYKKATGHLVELTDLYVSPKQRNKGYGKLLVGTALAYAQRYGWSVVIRIHPHGSKKLSKTQLIKFYKSFGFKTVYPGEKYWYILNTINSQDIEELY